jgi:hypothetical protein
MFIALSLSDPTRVLTGLGERMRASGPVERHVIQLRHPTARLGNATIATGDDDTHRNLEGTRHLWVVPETRCISVSAYLFIRRLSPDHPAHASSS